MKECKIISNLTDTILIVGKLPKRKKTCLSIQRGNKICKVASFDDEKCVEEFIKALKDMLNITRKKI